MDEETRRAIFEIRDCLQEMRHMLRLQKQAAEQAGRESAIAKDVLANMMDTIPVNLRRIIEPLAKKGD